MRSNRAVGLVTVRTTGPRFLCRAKAQRAIAGVVRNMVIGRAPAKPAPTPNGDQLSGLRWDMQMIGATPSGSYARQQGSHAARVGIIDTGVDGSHPDIAPNFDRALSHTGADRGARRDRRVVRRAGRAEPVAVPAQGVLLELRRRQTHVAAPGGDSRVFFGTPQFRAPQNQILNAYPLNVGEDVRRGRRERRAERTTTCDPTAPGQRVQRAVPLVRDCANGTCALYQWIQGTSMASPHAVGVAALIVAQFGKRDRANGGLTLAPARVEQILKRTATDTPCPAQEPFVYPFDTAGTFTATCEGTSRFNGFYSEGIVNAAAAVGGGR